MIKLNADIKFILNKLTSNGFEAYLVGGAVRNYLLGINPHDYDITTNATPDEIIDIFSFTKTILTGIKFGTVAVFYNHEKYEITTYREDGKYSDNRHPNNVLFTKSLAEDLKRRDFTVNALAYNEQIVDMHNGVDDLNNKLIRCIGKADDRFNEDALRILRALRFVCKLDFKIEENTKKSMFKNKDLIKNIAYERINVEILEIFKYKNIDVIIEYFDIFMVIFDFIKINDKEIIINKIKKLINNNGDEKLIYSAFFVNLSQEEIEKNIKKYKLSNEFQWIIKMVNNKKIIYSNTENCFRKLLKKIAKNDIILHINYNIFDNNLSTKYLKLLGSASLKCNQIKDLNINGNDLISLGINPNLIGIVLNELLDLIIDEKLNNEKSNLILYIKEKYPIN